ncbi:MAG: RNA polymerase sigma factor [Planctomycetota bacterium]
MDAAIRINLPARGRPTASARALARGASTGSVRVADEQPNLSDRSDEQLVREYVSGNRGALREIIDRHQVDLMRFLIRLTGSRDAAEDAFQEAFLQFHISAARFDTSRRLRPWLFTIAANKARDGLRKRNRQPLLALSAPVGDGATEFIDLLEIDLPDPSAGMLTEEQQLRVDAAVSRLSHPLREVLLLAYFQRLSYAQIADELGIPLGTVKSRLHAAVASFAKYWQESERGSSGVERSGGATG